MNYGSEGVDIKILLKNLPKSPGIYQFLDSKHTIIYIGKSVNLFSRVNSYFSTKSKLNFAKKKMVEQIVSINFIVTNTEKEALMLESTLIKKHQPKYNILLKDGKDHIYIKITNEIVPRIFKTRIKNKSGKYFGPYTSTQYATNILKIAKKIFGYRSCQLLFTQSNITHKLTIKNKGIKIPCIDYYIGRCSAPCLLEKKYLDNYSKDIKDVADFLNGNYKKIEKDLREKMLHAAQNLDFEQAQNLKTDLESMRILEGNQIVRDGINGDSDILNYIEKYGKTYIGKIKIRDSKINGFYAFEIINSLEESIDIIFEQFISSEYSCKKSHKSQRIILPSEIFINTKNIDFIKIDSTKNGIKSDLKKLCYKNTYEYAYKKHMASLSTKGFTKANMQNLLDVLGYTAINKNIVFECNDISHINGNHTVASRSVIENGKPNKNKYRKLRIKSLENQKIDDFNSMREVMTRRILELKKHNNCPDLLVIDGGKGQLSSVLEIVESSGIHGLQIASIAKREEELFLPGIQEPIILKKDSPELRMIQSIRDEAHRFAITFNRDSRIKSMKKNILEGISGIGPKTRKILINKYGNIENLKGADLLELQTIVPKNVIEALDNHGLL